VCSESRAGVRQDLIVEICPRKPGFIVHDPEVGDMTMEHVIGLEKTLLEPEPRSSQGTPIPAVVHESSTDIKTR
jgi:hypothetical protein